ncbi:kinase-like protein [Gymnopus androsaceus JB14]|uniref:Kinase-like protein n=1 Tax=Gymnopus androsaceus JB14 TaxID=1447944 RepID=A0A6A4HP86_9AGAR|nr:kinase-like protein [Gymnopus androsaceus JB14]
MASLDTISSLVQSRQFRIRLLQFAAAFHGSDYQAVREALKKDDVEIAKLLRIVVYSNKHKQVLVGLQGKDAQNCVDLMQEVLDRRSLRVDSEDEFYHHVQRLLVKLSECTDIIPTSLFIKGVNRQDAFACCGGAFGDIYRARYRDQDVALKRIRVFQGDVVGKQKLSEYRFCREALLWQRLRHPFVLNFCGIDSESFPSCLCMVSPWMSGGTILKHLNEYGRDDVERILFEIAQGLAYLHSQYVIHGDLRGSNILVNEDWHVCLADFGLAVFGDATAATPSQQAGSVRWMAPELHLPQAFDLEHFRRTSASDVYSFACVCVEVCPAPVVELGLILIIHTQLFTGGPPFADIPHDPAVMLRVMAGERPPRPSGDMPDRLWNVVQLCWSHIPSERPIMTQVVCMMKAANADLQEVVAVRASLHFRFLAML